MSPDPTAAFSPLTSALDRLRFETQYLVDVLHVAGPNSQCTISSRSLRQTVDGLTAAIGMIESFTGVLAGGVPPATGAAAAGSVQPPKTT